MKMKLSNLALLGGFALLFVGGVILSSCEGEQGPAGPPGADGEDGVDGVDGQDGQDANSTCILCHSDDQTIVTKSRQYANSGHSTGHASGYTNRSFGPNYDCAGCHTSQGFLAALAAGSSSPPYADVTQPNCYTCHKIHDTYTTADWALTSGDPVDPATGSDAVDLGSGNQCARCHQFVAQYLLIDSLFANFDDGGLTTVTLTAGQLRVGVHHAPQYNIIGGIDLFEFPGTYPTSENHITAQAPDGCVTCHMNDGFGDLTGHAMAITYEFHGSENFHWSATCTACHDGDDELEGKVTDIAAVVDPLMTQLYDLLVASGIMYAEGTDDEFLMAPGVFTTDLVAAHVNYNAIREDRSHGFHNPAYIEAILTNTIAALQ